MWGIVPAAGLGSRMQPLAFSKELLPVGSRLDHGVERPCAVSEYLVERMIRGGADKIKAVNALGVSILMVEQKARQCLAVADYGYVLEQGRNRLEGPAQALLSDPEVIKLYLGARARAAVVV